MEKEKVTLHPCQGWGCHEHCTVEVHSRGDKITRVQKHRMPGEDPCNEICMKGVLSAQIPYAKNRVLHPLKRVGERGEGKWEQISWEQALDEICDKIKKSTEKYGPRSIVLNQFWCGYPGDYRSTGNDLIYRFAFAWDASILEYQSVDYGLVFGDFVDYGLPCNNSHKVLRESNNLIIIWGGNPLGYTRPAATTRLLLDAQERGAKIIHISNLFDVSSARADEWIPVKSGTDAALAMGMANVLIRDGLVDREFLLKRTAAAYLVRCDTGKYLRAKDIDPDADEDMFVIADEGGNVIYMPRITMQAPFVGYGDFNPDLEAELELNGIKCKTSYIMYVDHVAPWTPEKQEEVTGVPAETCVRLAHKYVESSPATMYVYYGFRYGNGVQSLRALNALCFMSGNLGRPGGGTQ
ncbi:MAG: molybdopterin-dependent oxidoreductase, partial [Coriobacteriales bacterium]